VATTRAMAMKYSSQLARKRCVIIVFLRVLPEPGKAIARARKRHESLDALLTPAPARGFVPR